MTIIPVLEDKLKGVRIGTKCCVLVTGMTQVLRIHAFCFNSHLCVCPSEGMAGEMAAASALRRDEDNFYEPVTGGAAAERSCLAQPLPAPRVQNVQRLSHGRLLVSARLPEAVVGRGRQAGLGRTLWGPRMAQ